MARTRVSPEPVLRDWEQVDDGLRQIGEIDREIGRLEAGLNEAIDALKADYDAKADPLIARKKRLEKDIEEFACANRDEFAKRKSRTLTFGEVSFRIVNKVKPLSKWTWKSVVERLRVMRMDRYLRVKYEADKEAMQAALLCGEDLGQLGVRLCTQDVFGYKVNTEQLDQST